MKCRNLPGSQLFQYYDENGNIFGIKSEDVNKYLKSITVHDFTAKDFRTWGGTLAAFRFIKKYIKMYERPTKLLAGAVKAASEKLGNSPAVAKKVIFIHTFFNVYRKINFMNIILLSKKEDINVSVRMKWNYLRYYDA